MLKILQFPNLILRQKARPIEVITPQIKQLAAQMLNTLVPKKGDPLGVGLAANQVGKLSRIFIILMPDKSYQVIINPQIIKASKTTLINLPEDDHLLEGCLSVPGYYGLVNRPIKITVKYQTLDGRNHQRGFTMPQAIYFQHELDHLNGILFIDHITKNREQLYLTDKKGKLHEVENPFQNR